MAGAPAPGSAKVAPSPKASELRLTQTQIFEFQEAFDLFDKDGDGHVTKTELKLVCQTLGQDPSDDDLQKMIQEVDEDGSGCIEFEEFCALMVKNMEKKEDESTLCEAFKLLDTDGSGSIGRDELRVMMKKFSQATEQIDDAEIDALLNEADVDGDGEISYREFAKVMSDDG